MCTCLEIDMYDEIHHQKLNRQIAIYNRSSGPARDRAFTVIQKMVHNLVASYAYKFKDHPGLKGTGTTFDDIYGYLVSLMVFRTIKVTGTKETTIAPGALAAYRPETGVKFTTFYSSWLFRYGQSFVSRQKRLVHIPTYLQAESSRLPMVTHELCDAALDKGYFGTDHTGNPIRTVDPLTSDPYEEATDLMTVEQVLARMPESQAKNIRDYTSGFSMDEVSAMNKCSRAWIQACCRNANRQWQRIENSRI